MMRAILWQCLYQPGLEYLTFDADDESINIDSSIIGQAEGTPFCLSYHLTLDCEFRTGWMQIEVTGGAAVTLMSDRHGRWFNEARQPLPELDGCIDIDIMTTPFTNTLPIRRLNMKPGETHTLRMVYVSVPDLSLRVDMQRYTCLDTHHYRYDGLASGFSAVLTVDDEGLVTEYDGLFRKL